MAQRDQVQTLLVHTLPKLSDDIPFGQIHAEIRHPSFTNGTVKDFKKSAAALSNIPDCEHEK
uniref:Uncharacterized protein n=1 Tax=Heterorhabditis bacteriophora TaxID=37862 RepID=A0A1I7XPR6_HETBA